MPLAIYHNVDENDVDLECGMPVASSLKGEGRIQASELPAGKIATVTHMGPYENLKDTWTALLDGVRGPPTSWCALGSLRYEP